MNKRYQIQPALYAMPSRLGNRIVIVSLLLAMLLACLVSLSDQRASGQTPPEQARPADSFVNFLGVASHLSYGDTVYYQRYEDIIKPRLRELGIRHLRDSVRLPDRTNQAKFRELSKFGIKTDLIMDPREVSYSPTEAVAVAKTIGSALESVEGPNEWDLQLQLQYKGQSFPEGVRAYQSELYQAMKADATTAKIPVLTPSMDPNNAKSIGPVACDRANLHHYPYGDWRIPTDGLDDQQLPAAEIMCDNKPVVFTEAGYHNAIYNYGVSERASGRYLPRLLLGYFNRGVSRAYAYELIDLKPNPEANDGERHFGLLRNDGSPKPTFTALKNLITLLKDPQIRPKQPGFLTYSLTGDTSNISHTLLQKQNGTYYLILWQEVPSFDMTQIADIPVSDRPLTLNIRTPMQRATVYQPMKSLWPVSQHHRPSRLNLKVPDHPLVIKLEPRGRST